MMHLVLASLPPPLPVCKQNHVDVTNTFCRQHIRCAAADAGGFNDDDGNMSKMSHRHRLWVLLLLLLLRCPV